ncbi:hypothetical protein ABZX85_44035 [Streptomyces sp. NPDC004539]|uniref:hypothetical protein n=1 Tax=Streptomyces sp. NPDC004539 TaxID=3154280 RepID=UPI0033A94EC8
MNRDALTSPPLTLFTAPCCRCERRTGAAVACRDIHHTSGPGITLYACPDCILTVGVGPTSYDPVDNQSPASEDTQSCFT